MHGLGVGPLTSKNKLRPASDRVNFCKAASINGQAVSTYVYLYFLLTVPSLQIYVKVVAAENQAQN